MERVPLSQHLQLRPEDVDSPGLRVGWSVAGSSTMLGKRDVLEVPICFHLFMKFRSIYRILCFCLCLSPGEDDLSFAYDALGKKVSSGIEEDFGEPLSVGDIIGCYAVSDTSCFLSSLP